MRLSSLKTATRSTFFLVAVVLLVSCDQIRISVDAEHGSGNGNGTATGGSGSGGSGGGSGDPGQQPASPPPPSAPKSGEFTLPEISHAVKQLSIEDVPRLPIVYFNPKTREDDWKWQIFTDLQLTTTYAGPIVLDVEADAETERQRLIWARQHLPKAKLVLYTSEHFVEEADGYAVAVWPHVSWEQAKKCLEGALATGKPVTAFINCRAPEDQAPDVREKLFSDDQLYRRATEIASLRGPHDARVGITFWTADYYNLSMKHAPIMQEVAAQGDRELVYLRRLHAHTINVLRCGCKGQQQPAAFKPTMKG